MKHAAAARKQIGIRTIFNIIGPLANPARTTSQLLGVFSPGLTETMAQALVNMGSDKAFVVHGLDPVDEISICGPTKISEVRGAGIATYQVTPEDFGFKRATMADIMGGDPGRNADIVKGILEGQKGAARDVAVLNAAFAICAASVTDTPKEGIAAAEKSIDSGAALEKLEKLRELSNRLAGQ
jgi:anthranilate phosphoribosyltransferase